MVDSFIPHIRFKMCKNQWEKNKLSKLAKFNPKSTLPEKFKYVDLESVLGTDLISYREVSRENAPSRAQRLAQKGDIFYQTVRPYQKNNYLFDSNEKDYVFSTGYAQLRPLIDSAFLLARLQEESFVNMVLERCTGTSYPAINSKDLSKISVTIPQTIEEQSAIGSLFRTLDDLIVSYKDNLTNYQSLKATMLSKMFPKAGQTVPEIRLDGFEGEWDEWKLSDISQKVTEKNKDNIYTETFTNSAEFGIINQRDFFDKDISNEKSLNTYYVVRNNDYVYNPRISNFAPVGPIKRNKLGRTGVMSPLYFVFRVTNSNIDLDFLETFFNTNTWHKFMKLNGDSGARADRFAIKDSVFLNMPISIPSFSEQQSIGSYFSNLDQLITSYQEKITQLETLKKKLLQDMFI